MPAYDGLEAALAAGGAANSPDLAVIATPAHLHVAMATQLANAGLHVLIEKPLSTNIEGIAQLSVSRASVALSWRVAYVYRCISCPGGDA